MPPFQGSVLFAILTQGFTPPATLLPASLGLCSSEESRSTHSSPL